MRVEIGPYPDRDEERTVNVVIDDYDIWNMDDTLSLIILPMLKKLRDSKQGAGWVADEDVPEGLRSSAAPEPETEWDVDDSHFLRWNYVLDCMIFAFESKFNDWDDQFWKSGDCDWVSRDAYAERIHTGFTLFGKYYQHLWT